jgi:hypothetical protein
MKELKIILTTASILIFIDYFKKTEEIIFAVNINLLN